MRSVLLGLLTAGLFVGGCGHCSHCEAAEPKQCCCVPGLGGGVGTCGEYSCPANGGRGPCSCSASAVIPNGWLDDKPANGDMGYWENGRLVVRYFAASKDYATYTGDGKTGSYSEHFVALSNNPATYQIPARPVRTLVQAVTPTIIQYFEPQFMRGSGGCSGGSCGRR